MFLQRNHSIHEMARMLKTEHGTSPATLQERKWHTANPARPQLHPKITLKRSHKIQRRIHIHTQLPRRNRFRNVKTWLPRGRNQKTGKMVFRCLQGLLQNRQSLEAQRTIHPGERDIKPSPKMRTERRSNSLRPRRDTYNYNPPININPPQFYNLTP